MYQTILIQPQLGGQLSINRKCGQKGGPLLSFFTMQVTAILGTQIWIEVTQGGSPVTLGLADWIVGNYQKIEWSQNFDSLTGSMLIPVLYISTLVQLYSQGYMGSDPHLPRFFSYQSLFTFFMLILITGDNQLVLFVGWEGVGLASYLQINFWFTRIAANMAAQKAFLMNRIGDWSQTLGIQLILCQIGDLSFPTILSLGQYQHPDQIQILSIQMQIGASAKSAQLGLHTWLANAMEGPTPVSAQIHAATMVTAGVYQQMRLSPLQEWSSETQLLITWLGGQSAQLGAACGILENDLKRVIAFSTTSQLGYMVVACGLSQYSLSLFHLINHAFFKAQLFQSAGSVIHALADQQDMRKMGSQVLFLPYTYAMILLGSQSQMAFPFLTGFYSKDLIQELAQVPHNFSRTIAYILALLAAFLSATYSVRMLIMTFLSKPHFPLTQIVQKIITEPSMTMLIPLFLLSLGSAMFGYLTQDLFLGQGSTFYLQAIFTHPNHISLLDGSMGGSHAQKYIPLQTQLLLFQAIPQYIKKQTKTQSMQNPEGCSILLSKGLSSSLSTGQGHSLQEERSNYSPSISNLLNEGSLKNHIKKPIITIGDYTSILNHFNIFTHWVIFNFLQLGQIILRYWDRGLVEIFGPQGLVKQIHHLSFLIELQASGNLIIYAFIVILVPLIFQFNISYLLPLSLFTLLLMQNITQNSLRG